MKQVTGTLKLDLAQYRELEAFSQFASDLDKDTKAQLDRGARMVELLKQGIYAPIIAPKQVCSIYAGVHGHFDTVPLQQISVFEQNLYEALESEQAIITSIAKTGELSKSAEKSLKQVLKVMKKQFIQQ